MEPPRNLTRKAAPFRGLCCVGDILPSARHSARRIDIPVCAPKHQSPAIFIIAAPFAGSASLAPSSVTSVAIANDLSIWRIGASAVTLKLTFFGVRQLVIGANGVISISDTAGRKTRRWHR